MRTLLIGIIGLFLCTACNKQGSTEELLSEQYEIDILFSPAGLGDSGYNDMILYGIQQSQIDNGFCLNMHLPDSVEKGWNIYQQWLSMDETDAKKRMFIFAGNDYEELLIQQPPTNVMNKAVVLFETSENIANVFSFNLETYGAAYIIGRLASDITNSAVVLAANPEDKNLEHCIVGFKDGYTVEEAMHDVTVSYLADKKGMGYNMADKAYQFSYELYQFHSFVFPLAGRSNMGVWRYTREYPNRIYSAGIDGDMSRYSHQIIASLEKRIDVAIEDFITKWMNGQLIAEHKSYGFDTEYVNVVIAEEYKEYFASPAEELKAIAIKKEKEYVYDK